MESGAFNDERMARRITLEHPEGGGLSSPARVDRLPPETVSGDSGAAAKVMGFFRGQFGGTK